MQWKHESQADTYMLPKMQLKQKQECYDLALRYMFEPT